MPGRRCLRGRQRGGLSRGEVFDPILVGAQDVLEGGLGATDCRVRAEIDDQVSRQARRCPAGAVVLVDGVLAGVEALHGGKSFRDGAGGSALVVAFARRQNGAAERKVVLGAAAASADQRFQRAGSGPDPRGGLDVQADVVAVEGDLIGADLPLYIDVLVMLSMIDDVPIVPVLQDGVVPGAQDALGVVPGSGWFPLTWVNGPTGDEATAYCTL